jgi:hypothetical protein
VRRCLRLGIGSVEFIKIRARDSLVIIDDQVLVVVALGAAREVG